ncbi:hypothetical protein CORC01_11739 [Colletotrichum orchidophilum]|uniref:Uncharacterized protein n=1 Tax=Colletotrichum orchidophilum TaxID=1209926 RepID=A0A1G4AV25_9PEZI|nr:uncharacterized protein CORC01_11739 [Colletotrichum orchidophilum]OHE92946.1 hypothetical protein CORC01_11739 [Colletotrichum orchidophilum]
MVLQIAENHLHLSQRWWPETAPDLLLSDVVPRTLSYSIFGLLGQLLKSLAPGAPAGRRGTWDPHRYRSVGPLADSARGGRWEQTSALSKALRIPWIHLQAASFKDAESKKLTYITILSFPIFKD